MHIHDRSCKCPHHQPRQAPHTIDAAGGVPVDKASIDNGYDLANRDLSVRPQDDFYRFAVGGWKKSHPIPAEKASIGTFDLLNEGNRAALHKILEGLQSENPVPGSDDAKLKDYYASGMDTAAIEAAGTKPLQPLFDGIEAMQTRADVQKQVTRLQGMGVGALFSFGATPDYKDSQKIIAGLDQGGLGLPEREFYFKDDEKSKEIRREYVDHMKRTFVLLGETPEQAAASAQGAWNFELKLAELSMSVTELRDPAATYHIKTTDELQQMSPGWDWNGYFQDRGVKDLKSLCVGNERFVSGLGGVLDATPLEEVKDYLRWQTISAFSFALGSKFEDENFAFSKVLSGVEKRNERWKKIVSSTDNALGEALGRKFIETNFSPEAKSKVLDMIKNIRAVMREDIQELDWMDETTKKAALAKLDTVKEKIGYPEKWQDYSELEVVPGPFVQNVMNANVWANKQGLSKIGTQADPNEWGMTPPTVNAYYNPLNNEIAFPAGILQPPFFNPKADDAINYGAVGVVMGHELTHGFDDSGAQFDEKGNMRNWWTDESKARFNERMRAIVEQANGWKVQEGLNLNGELVQGEAAADLGGVEVAFQALQRSLKEKGDPGLIDGYTPEQRFFLGFAQVWANNERPESERMQVQTDPHPVAEFRVNGTLQNIPEFQEAFQVAPGDPMYKAPDKQISLWD